MKDVYQKSGLLFIFFAGVVTCGALLFSSNHVGNVSGQVTQRVPQLPSTHYNYANPDLPNYFEQGRVNNTDNTPNNNQVTDAGATLGRVLFYDVKLSANDTTSCSSCHQADSGFSDPRQFSVGFQGGQTPRNSMGLSNARYYDPGAFFWDERAATLETQVLLPIQNSVEMGMDLDTLVTKLTATDYYEPLFEDAFGDDTITNERISRALAQFVRSMVSYQSKFDTGQQTDFTNFTAQEEEGRQLFNGRGQCSRCHTTEVQVADQARNNGVDNGVNDDVGVGATTNNANDDGKFKTPSLRNIELTGPYMHDGRFATLDDVLQFYSDGIQDHPNLDPILQTNNGNPRRLNLNGADRAALIAFLNTLTDETFINDVKFADPFVETVDLSLLTEKIYLPSIVR
ncbi:MAG: cytochrome c peroxidase [Cellvibrionaceae bacterium]|jgi:cytochrome c peroxidase